MKKSKKYFRLIIVLFILSITTFSSSYGWDDEWENAQWSPEYDVFEFNSLTGITHYWMEKTCEPGGSWIECNPISAISRRYIGIWLGGGSDSNYIP